MKRPFWMHQLAEYLVGGALVAYGLRSPTPTVPAVVGALIAAHAAFTEGPLSAFRVIPRRVHRMIDLGVIAGALFAAVQPWVSCESSTRAVVILAGAALALMWMNSSFTTRADRRSATTSSTTSSAASSAASAPGGVPEDRATVIGRSAGRVAGKAMRSWRDRRQT